MRSRMMRGQDDNTIITCCKRSPRAHLAERDAEDAVAHALLHAELAQRLGGVYARTQHKDERAHGAGVAVDLHQVKDRRLDEPAAEVGRHERAACEEDAVRAQAAHEEHALQVAALGLPLAGELGGLRGRAAVPRLPLARGALQGRNHAAERRHGALELRHVIPRSL